MLPSLASLLMFGFPDRLLPLPGPRMTTDKAGGKAAQLRTMIIRAWRERWSDSQFATQVLVLHNHA